MAKKVKVMECCVITTDDKGQRQLVGKAKEALNTMKKNGVEVYIFLDETKKDTAETFLKENGVEYKGLLDKEDYEDGKKPEMDLCILPAGKTVLLRDNWQWALDEVVSKLYGHETKKEPTEQEKMDAAWKDYASYVKKTKNPHALY